MARDGSGNFLLPAGNPVVTGTNVSSNDFNSTMGEIRDALTQSIAKDGQTTPTANLPMGGNRHTGVGDGTAANHYASVKQLQTGATALIGSVANATDAYTGSLSPALTAYVDGMYVTMMPSATNTTTTPTLALNGLATKTIVRDGGAVAIGDLVLNKQARLTYQAVSNTFILNNPATNPVADGSLSANVPLKNAANTFTATQTITAGGGARALNLNGANDQYTAVMIGGPTTGHSYGLIIEAGTNAADLSFAVYNQAGSNPYFVVRGDGVANFLASVGVVGAFSAASGSFVGVLSLDAVAGNADYLVFKDAGTARGYIGKEGIGGLISGASTNDISIRADTTNINFTTNSGGSVQARMGASSGTFELNDAGTFRPVGYQGLPIVIVTSATLTASHNGKYLYPSTGGGTITIPANASVALPIGFSCVIDNDNGSAVSIAINTDTLVQVGTGATGTRTLGANGQANLVKVAATRWRINGTNLS
jgi:hypothetical protein